MSLRAELLNVSSPLRVELDALIAAGNDQGIADAMNQPRAGAGFQVVRSEVSTAEVKRAIAAAPNEYSALPPDRKDLLRLLLADGVLEIGDAASRQLLHSIFPAGSATYQALVQIATRSGSRAERLGLRAISAADVAAALSPDRSAANAKHSEDDGRLIYLLVDGSGWVPLWPTGKPGEYLDHQGDAWEATGEPAGSGKARYQPANPARKIPIPAAAGAWFARLGV